MQRERNLTRWAMLLAGTMALAACAQGEDEEPRPRLEIIIDDNGVPHVYGQTDADAFFGAGYQMASDRLFHMETTRRRAYGTLSEVLGDAAQEDDEISRLFDFAGWGVIHEGKMQEEAPQTHSLIKTWTDGINARIAMVRSGEADAPYGFGTNVDEYDFMPEDWSVTDVMVIATMTGFGNDLTFDAEAFASIAVKLFPEAIGSVQLFKPARRTFTTIYDQQAIPDDAPRAGSAPGLRDPNPTGKTPDELGWTPAKLLQTMEGLKKLGRLRVGIGSNSWAISGEHTANGRPIVAGDPHLDWETPGVFYAQHINAKDGEGSINAAGFSFAGTPGISVGHTDAVVWTPTTAFADTMDVWTVAKPDLDHVTIAGQTLPIQRREEIIVVRQEGDVFGEGRAISIIAETVEGYGVILPSSLVPIPLGEEGDIMMMNWVGFQPNGFKSILDFNRVESVEEYETAVDGFGANFNFVAADADGITHRVGTKVPSRSVNADRTPWFALDADDPATLWQEVNTGSEGKWATLTPEQLPRGRGGDRGFIVTANNDPFGYSADGDLTNDPYYFGAFFAPAWRAGRIEAELYRLTGDESGDISLQDVQTLQNDCHEQMADDLIPLLEAAWANVGSDPALAEYEGRADIGQLVADLSAWDRQMRRDSVEAVSMFAYEQMLTQRAIGDDMELLFLNAMELQPVFIMKLAVMAVRGEYPEGDTVLQEGRDWVLLAAAADVVEIVGARLAGRSYGDVKKITFAGTTGRGIDRGTFAADGGESTVNVAARHNFFNASGGVDEQWHSPHGPIFRTTTTFDDDGTPQLHFNMPLGNVADPGSRHFGDLHDDWLNAKYRRMWYTRDEVEEHEERRFTLRE